VLSMMISTINGGGRWRQRGMVLQAIRSKRLWQGVAIGTVAALALGACSSSSKSSGSSASSSTAGSSSSASSSSSSSAATPATTGAPAPTKSPIVIGVLAEQTGPQAGGQAYVAPASKAWADWVNTTQGGINGHPVQVQVLDTAGDAATAQANAQKLIDDKTVVMISLYSSATEAAISKLLSGSGVAITGQGYDTGTWGADIRAFKLVMPALPNFFTTSSTVSAIVDVQAASGKVAGKTKMAVATCAEIAACAQADPLYKASAAENGLAYDGLSKVAVAAPNYTAECVKAVADGVDFYQQSASAEVGLRVAKDCVAQGYKGWFGASGATADATLIPSGQNWAGGINGFPWWSTNPAVATFRSVMEAAKVTYQTPAVTGMWANLELFRKALANAGDTVGRSDVLTAFNSISGESLGGLLPQPVTFTAGKTAPPVECAWIYELQNGAFSSPEGDLKAHCFSATPPKA